MTASIQILGSHRLFRESLAAALRADGRFEVVDCGGDWERALPPMRTTPADLVVVELCRVDDAALLLLCRLARELGRKVLAVGLEPACEGATRCVEAGARGCLPASASLAELSDAIERVLGGGVAYTPEVTSHLFERLAILSRELREGGHLDALALTGREVEILQLAAGGLTNREIAERLALSVHTIKNHLRYTFRKLNVPTRSEAVRLAFRQGWLESAEPPL